MDFEVIVNCSFSDLYTENDLNPIANKSLLSFINDFEDLKWRQKKFLHFIWDNVAETSLSYKERESLVDKSQSVLSYAAQNLRLSDKYTDIGKGSEIAEIVLYAIMKHHFRALPVVPKIFYKQNSQDNAKGCDSVHILVIDDSEFSLWFGEAKFFNSIEDTRLSEIINSVQNSLSTDKLKKENSIITNVGDINYLIKNKDLINKIKEALSSQASIDLIKPKLNIPILLLHECEITRNCTSMSEEYKQSIVEYHIERAKSYFKRQVTQLATIPFYEKIRFHLILFPVPHKATIVDDFISMANFHKKF